ncbi:MAG: response regulator [Sphingobium sp.]
MNGIMGIFSHRPIFSRGPISSRGRIGNILIVEDEPLIAFENEHALAQAGYHVVATVDRYEHAAAAMADGGVDLVVADIRLSGGKSGVDVARHALTLDLPVLFSTATCPRDAPALALACLAKPYGPRDLVRAIRVIERVLAGGRPRLVPEMMTLFPLDE